MSAQIRRVASYDDGGAKDSSSPPQLRQVMSFDPEQRLLLSPYEESCGDLGIELNLVPLPISLQRVKAENKSNLDVPGASPSGGADSSGGAKSLVYRPRDNELPAAVVHATLQPLAETETAESQFILSAIDSGSEDDKEVQGYTQPDSEGAAFDYFGATSTEGHASVVENDQKIGSDDGRLEAIRISSPICIGSVLAASKSSRDAAEAAIKRADKLLSERSGLKSYLETDGSPTSVEDRIISEARSAAARNAVSSISEKPADVISVEDKIILDARNAVALMKSARKASSLSQETTERDQHESLQDLGSSSSPQPTDKVALRGEEISPAPDSSGYSSPTMQFIKPDVGKQHHLSPLGNGANEHVLATPGPDSRSEDMQRVCSDPLQRETHSLDRSLKDESRDDQNEIKVAGDNASTTDEVVETAATSMLATTGHANSPEELPDSSRSLPSGSAHDADNALESVSPDSGPDISDEAYSKLPGKLSYSPNANTRNAMLNTLDGVKHSPARKAETTPSEDLQQGINISRSLSSEAGSTGAKNTILPMGNVVPTYVRYSNEPSSKIQDIICDVKTNLATSNVVESDGRMDAWMLRVFGKHSERRDLDDFEEMYATYTSGESKTMIVHEIRRGDWTWCSAWSPDGDRLAVATCNHHLAIIDTASSSVWKVVHDKKISGVAFKGSTHSVRSVAWGSSYIAIGGTGDSVSIIRPSGQYPIVHVICGTGYVGSLSWRTGSSILAIGSRDDRCLMMDIKTAVTKRATVSGHETIHTVSSALQHTVKRRDWVNAVAFSSDGKSIAMGDGSGLLSVFTYFAFSRSTSQCKDFQFGASILDIAWSYDRQWLYSGGEDFTVTVINTTSWSIVKQIQRERWCECISPSHSGKHLVAGGGNSGLVIFGVESRWKLLNEIGHEDIIPLSATWHPKDHYLAMTGQSEIIAAIETTDIPYVKGRYIKSKCRISSIDFSPDGKIMAVANGSGLVSFFDATKSELEIIYEIIGNGFTSVYVRWSPNGKIVAISCGDSVTLLHTLSSTKKSRAIKTASRFGLRQTFSGFDGVKSVSFSPDSKMIAVNGPTTAIYETFPNFRRMQQLKKDPIVVSSWSPDGTLFAMVGRGKYLLIYDTSESALEWKVKFTLLSDGASLALAWGPSVKDGLQYIACGGEGKKVTILEIRTKEMTWETVLKVPRTAKVTALDWNASGLLAVGCCDGSTAIIDLGYLLSGKAVNEMDYDWQKQGSLGFTEILRTENHNSMTTLKWLGANPYGGKALALGGTDGIVEILDLTERRSKGV